MLTHLFSRAYVIARERRALFIRFLHSPNVILVSWPTLERDCGTLNQSFDLSFGAPLAFNGLCKDIHLLLSISSLHHGNKFVNMYRNS